MAIPTNPDIFLTRRQCASALTELGYKHAPATLATKASRGGGPPFRRFGRIPLYRWGDALEWAQSRLSPPICSTAELDAARQREPADARTPAAELETAAPTRGEREHPPTVANL